MKINNQSIDIVRSAMQKYMRIYMDIRRRVELRTVITHRFKKLYRIQISRNTEFHVHCLFQKYSLR